MKECGQCEKQKPESEFYRREASPDGLQSICKACSIKNCAAQVERKRLRKLARQAERSARNE